MAVKPKQSCGGRKTTKRPFPFFKFKLIKVDKILDSKQTSIDSKKSQKDNSINETLKCASLAARTLQEINKNLTFSQPNEGIGIYEEAGQEYFAIKQQQIHSFYFSFCCFEFTQQRIAEVSHMFVVDVLMNETNNVVA